MFEKNALYAKLTRKLRLTVAPDQKVCIQGCGCLVPPEGSEVCVLCEIRECRKIIQACRINMPPEWVPLTQESAKYTRELEMQWLKAQNRIRELHSLISSPETNTDVQLDEQIEDQDQATAVCAERPSQRSLFDLERLATGKRSRR